MTRAPPAALFGALSLSLHLAAFGVLGRRSSEASRSHAFAVSSPPLTGDTIQMTFWDGALTDEPAAPDDRPAADMASKPPHDASHIEERRDMDRPGEARDAAGQHASRKASSQHQASTGAEGTGLAPSDPIVGAVGVPFAIDLSTAFTRAFPQAASTDPLWLQAPLGSAGNAEVSLTLDSSGRIVDSAITDASSPAVRRGVERTIALLGARPFTAHTLVTRLVVSARVSRDDVHDGLHGDVFALSGGSFAGTVGSAFFALPPSGEAPGRRIDVELRLAR